MKSRKSPTMSRKVAALALLVGVLAVVPIFVITWIKVNPGHFIRNWPVLDNVFSVASSDPVHLHYVLFARLNKERKATLEGYLPKKAVSVDDAVAALAVEYLAGEIAMLSIGEESAVRNVDALKPISKRAMKSKSKYLRKAGLMVYSVAINCQYWKPSSIVDDGVIELLKVSDEDLLRVSELMALDVKQVIYVWRP